MKHTRTMAIAAAKAAEEMAVVDTVADAVADEAGTVVVMVLLPAAFCNARAVAQRADPWPANFSRQ